jgi:asparagine synthetase B (glutamine-hydrolysing)
MVCGALGHPSRGALRRLRKALGRRSKRVLDEDGIVLFLDRDPLRWTGDHTRGVAWAEALPVPSARPRTWQEAASAWGASGIVFDGGRWRLHTSVSGLAPLYYLTGGGATYFSSRIDALVAAADEPLGIDWDGWAGIFAVGYPLGERTPFVEIRRLEPAACVEHSPGGAAVRSHGWPWAQVDPAIADREVGAGAIAEALREQFTWLPPGEPIHSLLSGGWDSRLLLALAHERGDRPIRAWTVNNDVGHYEEERIAKIVTTELGIDHEIVPPRVGNFWEDWTETAALQDFQVPTRIRVLRLARLLRQQRGIALEGIAGDIFIKGSM